VSESKQLSRGTLAAAGSPRSTGRAARRLRRAAIDARGPGQMGAGRWRRINVKDSWRAPSGSASSAAHRAEHGSAA